MIHFRTGSWNEVTNLAIYTGQDGYDYRCPSFERKRKKQEKKVALLNAHSVKPDAECRASEYSLFKDNHLHIHVIRAALCL